MSWLEKQEQGSSVSGASGGVARPADQRSASTTAAAGQMEAISSQLSQAYPSMPQAEMLQRLQSIYRPPAPPATALPAAASAAAAPMARSASAGRGAPSGRGMINTPGELVSHDHECTAGTIVMVMFKPRKQVPPKQPDPQPQPQPQPQYTVDPTLEQFGYVEPPAAGSGFMDRYRYINRVNPNALMQLGAGIMAGNIAGGFSVPVRKCSRVSNSSARPSWRSSAIRSSRRTGT